MKWILLIPMLLVGCQTIDFPGFDAFSDIARNDIIKNAVAKNAIGQNMNPDKGYLYYTIKNICGHLVDLHNRPWVGDTKMPQRKFLGLDNEQISSPIFLGVRALSRYSCVQALMDPVMHQEPRWLDRYAGTHIGHWYDKTGGPGVEEKILYYRVTERGFQFVQHLTRCGGSCDCSQKDSITGADCSWAWNFADLSRSMPYLYRWAPRDDKPGDPKDGVFVGFPILLESVGFPKAECVVWIGLNESCLQCFNRAVSPTRVTHTCYSGFGRYEIKDTSLGIIYAEADGSGEGSGQEISSSGEGSGEGVLLEQEGSGSGGSGSGEELVDESGMLLPAPMMLDDLDLNDL